MPDPNSIRIKRSNTTTNTPSSLLNGELASNISDQKLWIGNSSNTPILLSDITNTFVNQGAWDYYAAYNKNAVVTYAGIFYYSISAVPPYNTSPNINTTYWAILSDPSGSSGSYLPLAGGAMTGSITSVGTTHDTEVAGDFFGVQLSADNTQGTMLNFDGLDTYDGANHMFVNPTGLIFPDSTTQTTAYTDTTARNSISSTATGLTYTSATGVFSLTASYEIPTTTSTTNWDSAYTQRLQWDGGSTNLVAATGRTSLGATTVGGNLLTLTNPSAITFLQVNANNTVSTLTAASFRSAIGAGTSSTSGTVTSVAITVPTGLSVSGTPITSTGTLAVTLTAGYSIPTTTSQGNWDTAYTNRITSLTTTGSSGSATLTTNTLNIPTYTLSGLGGQASSTNLTSVAGLTYVSASFVKMTAANTFSLDTSTYLTANQTITLSGDVSGSGTTAITTTLATVPITKGGTGQTTANAAVNALLPSQTSNSGKYLTTDGSDSSWGTVSTGTTIPSASMQMFAGAITQSASAGVVTTTAPTGWLLCNGDAVSRTTYSALWTALGQTSSPYGQGNGSTTFNLPDLRSRVPVGVGQASGFTNRTLGGTVGEENTSIGSTNLPSHSHTFSPTGTLNSENSHYHASANAGFHAHASNNSTLLYVGSGGGANLNAGTTWQAYNFNATMQGNGDHNHGNTNVNSGHTHTFTPTAGQTTGNGPGTGASLTNMQPSIGMNYIIKT